MQNEKDYVLHDATERLAALNPHGRLWCAGVVRPGTLVDENELPSAWVPVDGRFQHRSAKNFE